MNQKRFLIVLPGLLLCSCQSGKVADPAAMSDSSPTMTSPADYKKAKLDAALRGLHYDSGLVEVDNKVARKIVRGTTPDDAAESFERGEELLLQNRRTGAIKEFTRAVLIAQQEATYYEGLGRALMFKGLADKAAAAFSSALQLNPDYFEAQYNLAAARQMQGDQQLTNEAWRNVLHQDPDHAEAHSRLAIGLYYAGDYGEAWQHVHAAEDLDHEVPPQFRVLLAQNMPEPVN